ncbi:MAG: glutamate synthase subunit beta [Clostridiales Family XIII bacterium]|jgi:glutamate synthase (NADPH/NADH) small chain|nr:glutamate synthase subunit beta [Clostridiales Family XIII bacterium]
MGKPTGFLEYGRSEAGHRPVAERIRDFEEFVVPQGADALHTQSARCMDCGVPFCHAGFVVQGGSIGCPLCNLIPEVNDLVYRGELGRAFERLLKTHPFPEFTSRVCPALCEGSCTLGEHEPPVTIKEIERFVIDEAIRGGLRPRYPKATTGKRVAVVGSGPSGLACADVLNQLGYAVTVFERADRAGGLLMYGIPNMKLSKDLVDRRVRLMQDEGVRFTLNADVGSDYPVLSLMRDFDAIVLCAGATAERLLSAPGADLAGVVTAMAYLSASTKNLLDGTPMPGAMSANGKDVVVVGGGDTGTDCVGTAIRRGAKSVSQFEIMPPLPEERAQDNPWPLWPRKFKTDYGQEEAAALFGADPREYLTTVKEVKGDGHRVTGVVTVQVRWEKGAGGRLTPVEIGGSERERPCGLLLTAMGFTGPEPSLIEQMNLATDARGFVSASESDYRTSLPTVFACGDMRRGPSLVVWAILEGMNAAKSCDKYLKRSHQE